MLLLMLQNFILQIVTQTILISITLIIVNEMSYLVWKNSPRRFLSQLTQTAPASMSSARPRSSGSAIIVSLLRLFGVSAKHFSDDVSTTVSQNDTTGSATGKNDSVRHIYAGTIFRVLHSAWKRLITTITFFAKYSYYLLHIIIM